MKDKSITIMCIICMLIMMIFSLIGQQNERIQNEQIKQLEQALTEQIQEVEVYRGILEEYQTEGIINE